MAGQGSPVKPPRPWFYVRVSVLSLILVGVLIYAYRDVTQRRARNDWTRTLLVGFILVQEEPVEPAAYRALRARAETLEERLSSEMHHYQPGHAAPFHVVILGPVLGLGPAPKPPSDDAWLSLLRYQWDLNRWVSAVDKQLAIPTRGFDTRIYLVVKPPRDRRVRLIEGASEEGGRVGVVDVQLDETMADFALFVATHELLHTLGASDKYTDDGSIMIPEGLAEPEMVPLFPQRYAEVMARHRAVDRQHTAPPKSIDELAIGSLTAREIGWLHAGEARTR